MRDLNDFGLESNNRKSIENVAKKQYIQNHRKSREGKENVKKNVKKREKYKLRTYNHNLCACSIKVKQ